MKRSKERFILILMAGLMLMPISNVFALELVDSEMIRPTDPDVTIEEMIQNLPETATLDNPDLLLINRDNRLEADLEMEFAATGSGHIYNAEIAEAFDALITAGELEGHSFQTVSAHRTMAFQANNFDSRYYMYINEGYSEDDAFYMTDLFVAPADATEHSTGLAFDLLGYDYNEYGRDLHQVYGTYPSAIWLSEEGFEYGFVVRYLEGKTDITGYEYEPWHIRYVGVENAKFMQEYGLTLEEYLSLIQLRDETMSEDAE